VVERALLGRRGWLHRARLGRYRNGGGRLKLNGENKQCIQDGSCGTLISTKGSNRMSSPAALPTADRALSLRARVAPSTRGGANVPPPRLRRRVQNDRECRRKGLKQLNPRPEMVWPRKRRVHKMWYAGAPTGGFRRSPRLRRCLASCHVADFGAQPLEIACAIDARQTPAGRGTVAARPSRQWRFRRKLPSARRPS
jgi:hypothetical protein